MKFMLLFFSMILLRCCWGPSDFQIMLYQQEDETLIKALKGKYNITVLNDEDISSYKTFMTFDENSKKISGFLGCNRFFGNYTFKNNSIEFAALGVTKMVCQGEANNIEKDLFKVFEKANLIMFHEGGFSLYNKKRKLITAMKIQEEQEVVFEYKTISRGASQSIIVNKEGISVSGKQKKSKIIKSYNVSSWDNLIKILNSIDIEGLSQIQAPSTNFQFDGAALASLKITLNGNIYETQPFDHGNPPKEIETLVKEILSIAQNIE